MTKTQAQTMTADYSCFATWMGGDDMPVEPDDTYFFIDITDTVPPPDIGDIYDPATQTWTYVDG
jgi:hypothetical protein